MLGDYESEMTTACKGKTSSCSVDQMKDMLFECREGIFKNSIYMILSCSLGCQDGGEGKSDHCE